MRYRRSHKDQGFKHEAMTREEAWNKHHAFEWHGTIPKRKDLSTLQDAALVAKLSKCIAAMEWVEKDRCEGWPHEFEDEFHDKILVLHFADEYLRMKNAMPPRLGNRKTFPPCSPNRFRKSARFSDEKKAAIAPPMAELLETLREDIECLEQREKDQFEDDDPKQYGKLNRTIALLIEVEKRIKTRQEGK